jgi:tRNA nucleotidyltransferase (CCA-adding enzyme)
MNMSSHWTHFQHGADVGVRGAGETLSRAFEQAALALTAVVAEPESVSATTAIAIECDAPDHELLLVDWLNALVFEMATRRMLFGKFEVNIQNTHLKATAWGEGVDIERHQPVVEVKGATYTELSVRQQPDGLWVAQCVVDV